MTQSAKSTLVTQQITDGAPIVRLKADMTGELRVILSAARVQEHETRDKVARRAPETHPDQWKLVRLMLEQLESEGEINFHEFSRSPKVLNEFREVSADYQDAVLLFLDYVGLELPAQPE